MKRLAILLPLLLLAPAIHAQRIHAFVSSGVVLSQVEGDELKGFKHIGYTGGVGALTPLGDHYRWGLSVEALFSQRGVYNNSHDPQNLYNIRLHLNYVDIPVLLHYQDPYGGMLFGLGLSYGRLVSRPETEHWNINSDYFIPDTNDMSFINRALMAVADMRFTIWRGLQFNIRWQYSILPVKREWTFNFYSGTNADGSPRYKSKTNDCYNHSISMRLIYQF